MDRHEAGAGGDPRGAQLGAVGWVSGPQAERSRPLEARGGGLYRLNPSTDPWCIDSGGVAPAGGAPLCKHRDRTAERGRKWEAGRMDLVDSRRRVSERASERARTGTQPGTPACPGGNQI